MKTGMKVALVPLVGAIGAVLTCDAGFSLMQIAVVFGFWSGIAAAVVLLAALGPLVRWSFLARVVTCAVLSSLIGGAAARRSHLAGAGLEIVVGVFVLFAICSAVFLTCALFMKESDGSRRSVLGDDDADDIPLPEPTDVANWPTPGANGRSLESIRWMKHR